MDLVTYQCILAKLVKDPIEILESLNPYKINMLHSASALLGELAELADARTAEDHKEEFGDAVFYLEAAAMAVKEYPEWEALSGCRADLSAWSLFDVSDYNWNPNVHWKSNLVIAAGNLFDVVKKHVFYNKPLTVQMVVDFRTHWKAVKHLIFKHAGDRKHCGWSMEELRQANIDKLSLRYPGLQFTDAAADARKDKVAGFQYEAPQGNAQYHPDYKNPESEHDGKQLERLHSTAAGESELPNEPSSPVETGDSPVQVNDYGTTAPSYES